MHGVADSWKCSQLANDLLPRLPAGERAIDRADAKQL